MAYIVYKHQNRWIDTDKCYIGQTKEKAARGTYNLFRAYKYNKKLMAAALGENDWLAFWEHKILGTFQNKEACDIAETYHILANDCVNRGYNNNTGKGMRLVFGCLYGEIKDVLPLEDILEILAAACYEKEISNSHI